MKMGKGDETAGIGHDSFRNLSRSASEKHHSVI